MGKVFSERTKLFVKKCVVQQKRTMDERNESFREIKKLSFIKKERKNKRFNFVRSKDLKKRFFGTNVK